MKTNHIIALVGAAAAIYSGYQFYTANQSGTALTQTQSTTYGLLGVAGAVVAITAIYYPHYMKHIESKLGV